jgi:hypothetical protein
LARIEVNVKLLHKALVAVEADLVVRFAKKAERATAIGGSVFAPVLIARGVGGGCVPGAVRRRDGALVRADLSDVAAPAVLAGGFIGDPSAGILVKCLLKQDLAVGLLHVRPAAIAPGKDETKRNCSREENVESMHDVRYFV